MKWDEQNKIQNLASERQMFCIECKVSSGRKTPYSDGKDALLIS